MEMLNSQYAQLATVPMWPRQIDLFEGSSATGHAYQRNYRPGGLTQVARPSPAGNCAHGQYRLGLPLRVCEGNCFDYHLKQASGVSI